MFKTSVFAIVRIVVAAAGLFVVASRVDAAEPPDPYKAYSFRVKWDGQFIDGVTRVSPLTRITEVADARLGSDPSAVSHSPGRTTFTAVTLERGLTKDTAFEAWADLVAQPGQQTAAASYRKDIIVSIYNETGQLVTSYKLYNCWPSTYEAVSDLDANTAAGQFQRLTLQCDSWTRDTSVVWPQ